MTRVALVTGASRGIGAAIARELAAAGCRILLNYRSDERGAAEVKDSIVAAGGDATLLRFDVGDAAETAAALAPWSGDGDAVIDVVVNNAGVVKDAPFPTLAQADWERVTRTSLDGFFNVTRPLVMPLVRRRWGRIITISSLARKRTSLATSDGSPSRRIGINLDRSSTGICLIMSVSMRPGATAFTVTLRLATSLASDRVAPIRPAFAAE